MGSSRGCVNQPVDSHLPSTDALSQENIFGGWKTLELPVHASRHRSLSEDMVPVVKPHFFDQTHRNDFVSIAVIPLATALQMSSVTFLCS